MKLLAFFLAITMIVSTIAPPYQVAYGIVEMALNQDISVSRAESTLFSSEPVVTTSGNIVEITRDIGAILASDVTFKQLTSKEKELILALFGIDEHELLQPSLDHIPLKQALVIVSLSQVSKLDTSQIIRLQAMYTDTELLTRDVLKLKGQMDTYAFTNGEMNQVIELLENGYDLLAASHSVYAAKVLNLPVLSIINESHKYEPSKGFLSEYHVDYTKIKNTIAYASCNELEIIEIIKKSIEFKGEQSNEDPLNRMGLAALNNMSSDDYPEFTKEVVAPFTYNPNTVQVSTATGDVIGRLPAYTLAGRNALNVVFSPQYMSQNASLYEADYLISSEYSYLYTRYIVSTVEFNAAYYDGEFKAVIYGPFYGSKTFGSHQEAQEFSRLWDSVSLISSSSDGRLESFKIKDSQVTIEHVYGDVSTVKDVVTPVTYQEKVNGIGSGWSWGLPSIEIKGNAKYLHLGNGQIYEVSPYIVRGEGNLISYQLHDMAFDEDASFVQDRTLKASSFVLKMKTGNRYYFDSDGLLLACVDRYDNKIQYFYERNGDLFQLKSIIDTIGREIKIEYHLSVKGKDVVVTLPSQEKLIYQLHIVEGTADKYTLSTFIDPAGNKTEFKYDIRVSRFSYVEYENYKVSNSYALLTQITYPTGAFETFTYGQTKQRLGMKGSKEQYRAIKHDIRDTSDIKTTTTYTYSLNNSTGYPNYRDTIPSDYTFQTTVTQNDLDVIYTFDKHQSVIEQRVQNKVGQPVSEIKIEYNSSKLPIKRTTTEYNPSTSRNITTTVFVSYDRFGNVLEETDALGVKTRYEYYIDNYLLPKKVSVFSGNSTIKTIEYSLTSSLDKNIGTKKVNNYVQGEDLSEITSYQYDKYGNTTNIATRVGSAITETQMEYSEEYLGAYLTKIIVNNQTYVSEGTSFKLENVPIIKHYSYDMKTGRLRQFTDERGIVTLWTYDAQGRVLNQNVSGINKVSYQYKDKENVVEVKNEDGLTYKYTYTPMGKLSSITHVNSGNLSTYMYNHKGQLTTIKDGLGYETIYQYDDLGRLKSTIAPGNQITQITYDEATRSKITTDAIGIEYYEQSDAKGQIIRIGKKHDGKWVYTTYTYDALGNVVESFDYLGNKTAYAYDSLGRLLKVTNALGEVTQYKYGLFDAPIERISAKGDKTLYVFDQVGNLIKTVNPIGSSEFFAYDASGSVIVSKDSSGMLSQYRYDAFGRNVMTITGGVTTEYQYNALNDVVFAKSEEDALRYTYTSDGLLLRKQLSDGRSITYEYDSINRLAKSTDYYNQVTVYMYGSQNQCVSQKTADKETQYSYYQNGLIKQIKHPNGMVELYAYTDSGLLATKTFLTKSGSTLDKYVYVYDANGNRIKESSNVGVKEYTYDKLNRLKQVSDSSQRVVYVYDKNGNIQTKTTTSYSVPVTVQTESYSYDGANKLIKKEDVAHYTLYPQIRITATHNKGLNNPRLKVGDSVTFTIQAEYADKTKIPFSQYSNMGISVTSGSNSVRGVDIDLGKLTTHGTITVTYREKNTATSLGILLTLYGSTRRIGVDLNEEVPKDVVPLPPPINPPVEILSMENTYESLSTGLATVVIKNPVVELSRVVTTYSYDSRGNLIKEIETQNGQHKIKLLSYNQMNQLISFTDTGGKKTTYAYYADGLRRSKKGVGYEKTYYYTGSSIVNEAENGKLIATNAWGNGILARITASGYVSYFKDGHGDVMSIYDMSGKKINSYEYNEYGKLIQEQEGIKNPFRYSGEYYDEETGYIYLRARYYDPENMRFISQDTYVGILNSPLSHNQYIYCLGNPLKYTDPSGNISIESYNVRSIEEFMTLMTFLVLFLNRDMLDFLNDFFYPGGTSSTEGISITGMPTGGKPTTGTPSFDFFSPERMSIYGFPLNTANQPTITFMYSDDYLTAKGFIFYSEGGSQTIIKNIDDGLNFSKKAGEHMDEAARFVPVQTLQDAIKSTKGLPDPRGSDALMHYTTINIGKKTYNLEVLYDAATNTIYHFEYARRAMGNLPAIPK